MAILHVTPPHAMPAVPGAHGQASDPHATPPPDAPGGAPGGPVSWLAGLCGQIGAASAAAWFRGQPEALDPEEFPAVSRAVPRRQREFAAGRQCARAALAQLGIRDFPIRTGLDRAPIWPSGVLGSITHTHAGDDWLFAASVVLPAHAPARGAHALGIGVDAEPAEPLPRDVVSVVLNDRERAFLDKHARPGLDAGVLARVLFSAKESVYKALSPTARQVLDFSDIEIALCPEAGKPRGSFRFRRLREGADRQAGADTGRVGWYGVAQGLVMTLALSSAGPVMSMSEAGMC